MKGRGDESYSLEYEFVTGPFPNHTVTEVDLFCNLSQNFYNTNITKPRNFAKKNKKPKIPQG